MSWPLRLLIALIVIAFQVLAFAGSLFVVKHLPPDSGPLSDLLSDAVSGSLVFIVAPALALLLVATVRRTKMSWLPVAIIFVGGVLLVNIVLRLPKNVSRPVGLILFTVNATAHIALAFFATFASKTTPAPTEPQDAQRPPGAA